MAHKKCLKKMRKHIWCDCINDDLEELKKLKKLIAKRMIKNICKTLASDGKAIRKLVETVYGEKR